MKNCFHGYKRPMILQMQSEGRLSEDTEYVEMPEMRSELQP